MSSFLRRSLTLALAAQMIAALAAPAVSSAVVLPTVRQLSAGYGTLCMVLTNGRIRCAGSSDDGELGNGSIGDGSERAVTVSGITNAVAMDSSRISTHSCALLADGTIKCWGLNYAGAIGSGTGDIQVSVPETVVGISTATAVATGTGFSCALMADHDVRCWGSNQWGKLGVTSAISEAPTPVAVPIITDATAIAAGDEHACALRSTGTITCWGRNDYGQLGNAGPGGEQSTVTGISDAIAIAAGSGYTCAIRADHTVWCWGFAESGPGSVVGGSNTSTPVQVGAFADAVKLSAGHSHACATRSGGSVVCWGRGMEYQLGNGGSSNTSTPQTVTGVAGAANVTAGAYNSCALIVGGQVDCWGAQPNGQFGDGTTTTLASAATVDFIAPVVSAPVVRIASGRTMDGSMIPVTLAYTAADASGVSPDGQAQASMDNGVSWGADTAITNGQGSWIDSTGTWRMRAIAVDLYGNKEAGPGSAAIRPALTQQTSTAVVYGGTWRSESNFGYSGGSVKYATAAGASATYRVSARSVGFVTTRGPGRGKVRIYVDGILAATVDTYAASATRQLVIWQKTWAAVGTHTVKLVVAGTAGRPRVDLDAFAVLR